MKENQPIQFMFVNPQTQNYGEILYNNSSESITMKYTDILEEIKKYCSDMTVFKKAREYIQLYKPFLVDIIKQSINELKPEINEDEVKKNIVNQAIKKEIKKHQINSNPRTIKSIEEKLNRIVGQQKLKDNMFNSRFSRYKDLL